MKKKSMPILFCANLTLVKISHSGKKMVISFSYHYTTQIGHRVLYHFVYYNCAKSAEMFKKLCIHYPKKNFKKISHRLINIIWANIKKM